MSPRDDALKADGVDNLFCGGEKAGLLVGHNAARFVQDEPLLVLPHSISIGDAITRLFRSRPE